MANAGALFLFSVFNSQGAQPMDSVSYVQDGLNLSGNALISTPRSLQGDPQSS